MEHRVKSFRIADCGFKNSKFKIRIFIWLRTIATCPLSPQETVSQFVIPAKSRKAGREPGSRKNLIILDFHWIPDLARLGGLVRNDGLEEIHENSTLKGGSVKRIEVADYGTGPARCQ